MVCYIDIGEIMHVNEYETHNNKRPIKGAIPSIDFKAQFWSLKNLA